MIEFMIKSQKSATSDVLMLDLSPHKLCQKSITPNSIFQKSKISSSKNTVQLESDIIEEKAFKNISDENQNQEIYFRIRKPRKIIPNPNKRVKTHEKIIGQKDEEDGSTSPSPEIVRSEEEKDDNVDYNDYIQKYSDWVLELQKEEDEQDESSVKLLHRMRMNNKFTNSPDCINDSPKDKTDLNYDPI